MKQHINQRMAALAHSEIRAMTQACVQAKGLNMAQGVCDTPVPPVVLRAAAQALERGKTPRTKAIIVNSPGNPSGKVFSRQELESIAATAQQHDLFAFTDEIYEYFLYDGRTHVSFATLPGMATRTITIGGYSKTFSITGWRIGYSVAAARWAQAIGAMNDLLYVCAPTPLQ